MKMKLGNPSDQHNKQLIGYADADWGGDTVDRKSNTGYIFKYCGSPLIWSSHKQSLVTLSSTEAEYIALSEAVKEALWIRRLLQDFDQATEGPTVIMEDNQSCIKMLQNDRLSHRTKHIATKYHFIRDLSKRGDIIVEYCPTSQMTADLLTKPLEAVKLRSFVNSIALV